MKKATDKYVLQKSMMFLLTILLSVSCFAQTGAYELFVSSRNTNSVKLFDADGNFVRDFVPPGGGGLNATQQVAFGPDGHLYVTGRFNQHILRYDKTSGAFLGNFTSGYLLDNPTKMTFGPDGFVYVSQWGAVQNKVARFDANTGVFDSEFTSIGLNQGCGHTWDADTNLYVASFGTQDVRKFDRQGNFMGVFTEPGHLGGAVNALFLNGNLLVVDWPSGAAHQFNGTDGSYMGIFLSGVQNAEGITIGPDSLIYVCDWSGNAIHQYDINGNFIKVFTTQGAMLQPNGLAWGPAITTGLGDNQGEMPTEFRLLPSYPNPFNPAATIRYQLPKTANVSIKIFTLDGKAVTTLVNERKSAGQHQATWKPENLPSGTYFYEMTAGDFRETRKLTYLK